jgi:hypothetical protein
LIASLRSRWWETLAALFAESAVCAGTAGFYGALVQAIWNAQPAWVTALVLTLFLPAVMQAVEYCAHWLRSTHHLHAVPIGSVVASTLSSLFNSLAMKRGALLDLRLACRWQLCVRGCWNCEKTFCCRLALEFHAGPARGAIDSR